MINSFTTASPYFAGMGFADFAVILNSLVNPIFVKDADLRFIFVNSAYERMFHIRAEDVIGKTVLEAEHLPAEDRLFYQREDEEILVSGRTSHHIFDFPAETAGTDPFEQEDMEGADAPVESADPEEGLPSPSLHTCLYWSSGFAMPNGLRGIIGTIVNINRQTRKVHVLRERLRRARGENMEIAEKSRRDALTGLYTRGYFDQELARCILEAQSSGRRLACIMLDIDHFKKVNDSFGHQTGDLVLKHFAASLVAASRKEDILCRYGGEEFVILLPGDDLSDAARTAERIRCGVYNNVATPDGRQVSASCGCAEYQSGESGEALVARADKALYQAKQTGRNTVVCG